MRHGERDLLADVRGLHFERELANLSLELDELWIGSRVGLPSGTPSRLGLERRERRLEDLIAELVEASRAERRIAAAASAIVRSPEIVSRITLRRCFASSGPSSRSARAGRLGGRATFFSWSAIFRVPGDRSRGIPGLATAPRRRRGRPTGHGKRSETPLSEGTRFPQPCPPTAPPRRRYTFGSVPVDGTTAAATGSLRTAAAMRARALGRCWRFVPAFVFTGEGAGGRPTAR